jgi:branched-chain amino acid transport system permease protein
MNNPDHPVNITNGPKGLGTIRSTFSHGFGQNLDTLASTCRQCPLYYYLFLFLAVFSLPPFAGFPRRRAWLAIREDEIAAIVSGNNTRNPEADGMANLGGVLGAMFASFQGFVSPESWVY